jgi:hypothetical protein
MVTKNSAAVICQAKNEKQKLCLAKKNFFEKFEVSQLLFEN